MHRNTFSELLPLLTVTLVSALKLNIQVLERWRGLGGNVRLSRLLMTSCLVSHGQWERIYCALLGSLYVDFFYTPSLTKVFGCVIWILNSQFNSSLTNLFHKSARLFCHHLFQTACTGASFQGGWHHCHRHRRHHHHHISVAANILALIKRESYINVDTRCVIEMFLGRRESRFALKVASKSARYQLRQKPLKFSAHICS